MKKNPGRRALPEVSATFNFEKKLVDLSSQPGRALAKPNFPVTSSGILEDDVKFKLKLKDKYFTDESKATEVFKITVLRRDTLLNKGIEDLVKDIQKAVDKKLRTSKFKNSVEVKWDYELRKLVFAKKTGNSVLRDDSAITLLLSSDEADIAFSDVQVKLGSFISNIAGPLFTGIFTALEPLDFLVGDDSFIQSRLPVLSDVAQEKVTILNLASVLGVNQTANFINAISQLRNLSRDVDQAAADANTPNREVVLNLGTFELGDVREKGGLSNLDTKDSNDVQGDETAKAPPEGPRDGKAKRFVDGLKSKLHRQQRGDGRRRRHSVPDRSDPSLEHVPGQA